MKVNLSGDDQGATMTIKQPVRNVPQAAPVILVKPLPETPIPAAPTTEDKIKKIVTWGSLGLLVYKLLKL